MGFKCLDVLVDMVFLFLYELRRPRGDGLPRKNGLAAAGEVSALPHEQIVLLGLKADALCAHQDFRITVRISGFDIFRAFALVGMNGEKQRDLLLCVFDVVVFVGDDAHNKRVI